MRSSFHAGARWGLFHILLAVIVCGAAGLARAAELPVRANESDEGAAKRRAGAKGAKKKPEDGG